MNKLARRSLWVDAAAIMVMACAGQAALAQRNPAINSNDVRTNTAIQGAFIPITREAANGTVRVRIMENGVGAQVALGTIITDDGYILTKASEIIGRDRVMIPLPKVGELEAKIVGYNELLDLAMLKIDAKGLTPVKFADTRPPAPPAIRPATAPAISATAPATAATPVAGRGRGGGLGRGGRIGPIPVVATAPAPPVGAIRIDVGEWVATPDAAASQGMEVAPRSVGVISTARRVVPGRGGFLGVGLSDVPANGGARITEVVPGSPAEDAGIKVDDVITAMEGGVIKTGAQLSATIRNYTVGDSVRLLVTRGEQTLVLRADLGDNIVPNTEDLEIKILSGEVSKRATYFPTVLQHDTILKPSDMGGPLVDLDGRVIGINIARAGRTETYALPADVVLAAMDRLKSGLFAPLPAKPVPEK